MQHVSLWTAIAWATCFARFVRLASCARFACLACFACFACLSPCSGIVVSFYSSARCTWYGCCAFLAEKQFFVWISKTCSAAPNDSADPVCCGLVGNGSLVWQCFPNAERRTTSSTCTAAIAGLGTQAKDPASFDDAEESRDGFTFCITCSRGTCR